MRFQWNVAQLNGSHVMCCKLVRRSLHDTWRSSGNWSILSFWRKWALGAPTNRFPLVWEKSSNGSGWKRRSKNCRSTGISRGNDRDVMSAFDFAPIYTPFDQHGYFAFDFGRFVDRWWLKEVWYAPDFLPNHCTVATLAVRKRNTRLEWTNLPWHASQKSRLWPVCR